MSEQMTTQQLIERFAAITNLSYEDANKAVGADTVEEILTNIRNFNKEKIYSQLPKLNRAQRRAFNKKNKKSVDTISDYAKKLSYIDLIQKLRTLNEKEIEENGETATEDN